MPTVSHSKVVPYKAHDMYNLVNDIESYAKFLPWCDESYINHASQDEIKASLVIAAGGMRKSFTTLNRLQQGKMIEMRLLEGPFKHLEGFWRFDSLENDSSCRVSFDIEFEFSGKLLSMAIGPMFNHVTNSLLDAFVKRAHEIYGKQITNP